MQGLLVFVGGNVLQNQSHRILARLTSREEQHTYRIPHGQSTARHTLLVPLPTLCQDRVPCDARAHGICRGATLPGVGTAARRQTLRDHSSCSPKLSEHKRASSESFSCRQRAMSKRLTECP